MKKEEIEAVLGHEMGHVANGDMVTMTLLQGVVNTFVIFMSRIGAQVITKALSAKLEKSEQVEMMMFHGISLALQVLFGLLASGIVRAYSRWREYYADKAGAEHSSSTSMINALKRLQSLHGQEDTSHESMGTLKISDKSSFFEWFSTHPPLEKRIAALETGKY